MRIPSLRANFDAFRISICRRIYFTHHSLLNGECLSVRSLHGKSFLLFTQFCSTELFFHGILSGSCSFALKSCRFKKIVDLLVQFAARRYSIFLHSLLASLQCVMTCSDHSSSAIQTRTAVEKYCVRVLRAGYEFTGEGIDYRLTVNHI